MTKRALRREPSGTILEVIADDPLAYIDIPHMCRREGFEVIETQRNGDGVRLLVRRN
ncbi:sulfurtransferase TusA family protein [Rhizomicrobium electricum]|jgi:tRNA 2-thiouridine synthesizing protein A|nr:sulfurtransferase TusA family protein [Rhizomicrobium electricum]NIJ49346.1 tRNA 2-thiouridine synthesizing protein A [Rhizomicrobium electricum]